MSLAEETERLRKKWSYFAMHALLGVDDEKKAEAMVTHADEIIEHIGAQQTEIESLRRELEQKDEALNAARKHVETLLTRISFAQHPIGACSHCFYTGNKPGAHHLSDCPAFIAAACQCVKQGEYDELACCREEGHAGPCNWVVKEVNDEPNM